MKNIVVQDAWVLEDQINQIKNEISSLRVDQDDCASFLVEQKETPFEYSEQINYFSEFWRYYIYNELIIKKVNEVSNQNSRLGELENNLEDVQIAVSLKYKKKNRRTASEIEKTYCCPYEKCLKVYGSDVSLNLHIKLKHEGGNKTDREKIAKKIIQAESSGEQITELPIKFPPGYLEKLRFNCQEGKDVPRKQLPKRKLQSEHTIFYDE